MGKRRCAEDGHQFSKIPRLVEEAGTRLWDCLHCRVWVRTPGPENPHELERRLPDEVEQWLRDQPRT